MFPTLALVASPNDLIAVAPVFRRLTLPDREQLAAVSHVRSYPRGATLLHEGEPARYLFVVASGRVKVYKTTAAGRDLILEILGSGDPIGAVAVYEERPYPASAAAIEDTVCLVTPKEAFLALLERQPSFVRGLLSGLTLRLIDLTCRLAEVSAGRVEARLARLFLKLADQTGRREEGGVWIPLRLSRQDLADLTGTTLETAIRVMSRWSKEGVVRTEREGFLVCDRAALEALGA